MFSPLGRLLLLIVSVAVLGAGFVYLALTLNSIRDDRAFSTIALTRLQSDIVSLKRENAALKEANAEVTAHLTEANDKAEDALMRNAILEERLKHASQFYF